MNITLLTSTGCKVCRGYADSLRKVGFEVQEIDLASDKGKEYMERYVIEGVPTLFVEVDELHNDILKGNWSAETLKNRYL